MQTSTEHLKAQQAVMQALNMYNGKIDGIWGPKSIAAKQKWERSGKFAPAIPNNGFPLVERAKLPPNVIRRADGTLICTLVAKDAPAQAPVATQVAPTPEAATETVAQEAIATPSGPEAGNSNKPNGQSQNQHQNQNGNKQQQHGKSNN